MIITQGYGGVPEAQRYNIPKVILKERLLIVEGRDEELILSQILLNQNIGNIQIWPHGGKDAFKKQSKALKLTPGYGNVIKIGILRDADEDPQAAFNSVCGALLDANLAVPDKVMAFRGTSPEIGIMILPDILQKGTLESLFVSSIEKKKLGCINSYLECAECSPANHANEAKVKVYAYLSAVEPGKRLGESASHWDYTNPSFGKLVEFLKILSA